MTWQHRRNVRTMTAGFLSMVPFQSLVRRQPSWSRKSAAAQVGSEIIEGRAPRVVPLKNYTRSFVEDQDYLIASWRAKRPLPR